MTDIEPQRGDAENEFLVAADIKPWHDQMECFEACRAEIVQSAREAALLGAARAVCDYCQEGIPLAYSDEVQFNSFNESVGVGWIHTKTVARTVFKHRCQAAAIHDLRAKKEHNDV